MTVKDEEGMMNSKRVNKMSTDREKKAESMAFIVP